MSLWAEYQKERLGKSVKETDDGFASYYYPSQEECYIEELYVRPEMRKKGLAKKLADEIAVEAKMKGCKYLIGSVDVKATGATTNIQVLISYGMQVIENRGTLIMFAKLLGD